MQLIISYPSWAETQIECAKVSQTLVITGVKFCVYILLDVLVCVIISDIR